MNHASGRTAEAPKGGDGIDTVARGVLGSLGGLLGFFGWWVYVCWIGNLEAEFPGHTNPVYLTKMFLIFLLLGFFTGVVVGLDRAKRPGPALMVGYTLLATLVLFVAGWANEGNGRITPGHPINLVPLMSWSLVLGLRAIWLIRHPER